MSYNLADLHTHSLCSDGLRTPTEAVQEACEAGLQAMSFDRSRYGPRRPRGY